MSIIVWSLCDLDPFLKSQTEKVYYGVIELFQQLNTTYAGPRGQHTSFGVVHCWRCSRWFRSYSDLPLVSPFSSISMFRHQGHVSILLFIDSMGNC